MTLVWVASRRRNTRPDENAEIATSLCVLDKIYQCINGPPLVAGVKIQTGNCIQHSELRTVGALPVDIPDIVGVGGASESESAAGRGRKAVSGKSVAAHLVLCNCIGIVVVVVGSICGQLQTRPEIPASLDLPTNHVGVRTATDFPNGSSDRYDPKVIDEPLLPVPGKCRASSLRVEVVIPNEFGSQPRIGELPSCQGEWLKVVGLVHHKCFVDVDRSAREETGLGLIGGNRITNVTRCEREPRRKVVRDVRVHVEA